MATIVFADRETERRALAFLLGRFSGRVLKSGEHIVPEAALEALAEQNIPFASKGRRRTTNKSDVFASSSSPTHGHVKMPLRFSGDREFAAPASGTTRSAAGP